MICAEWEERSGQTFLVNGVNFMEYISQQREDHISQLEAERIAREQVREHSQSATGAHLQYPAKYLPTVLYVLQCTLYMNYIYIRVD